VLSVLIVCFFAVALYQRDPPRPPHGQARSGIGDTASRSVPATRPSSVKAVSTRTAQSATAPREGPERPIALASDSSIKSVERVPEAGVHLDGADSVGFQGSNNGRRIGGPRRPESAFTVVVANETLEDIARRVYGSSDLADSLWRSNRDALSRKESPLAAGMVLRTPVIRSAKIGGPTNW
jgi:nucleoid-associated protein YgaU